MSYVHSDWQSRKTLQECNYYMFSNELGCDVTFLVGKDLAEIKAHRYVLGSRSPVFFAMFYGPLANYNAEISLQDDDEYGFEAMLRYLYCEEFHINDDNVTSTLMIANKYGVPGLEDACIKHLMNSVSSSNVFLLLNVANLLYKQDLKNKCLRLVQDEPHIIKSTDFLSLTEESLKDVLKLDRLNMNEEELFENVIRWAQEECINLGLKGIGNNMRMVLESCLPLVRFPLMDKEYLNNKVLPLDILTKTEEYEIRLQTDEIDVNCSTFMRIPRIPKEKIQECIRFQSTVSCGHWRCPRSSISFSVNACVAIYGLILYNGNYAKTCNQIDILVEVQNDDTVSLPLISFRYCTTVATDDVMYKVKFDNSFDVIPGKFYTVTTKVMNGCSSYNVYGDDGFEKVVVDDVTFTFINPTFLKTDTSVTKGQIPGILFTKCGAIDQRNSAR